MMLGLVFSLDPEIDLTEESMTVYPLREMQQFWELREEYTNLLSKEVDREMLKGLYRLAVHPAFHFGVSLDELVDEFLKSEEGEL